MDRLSRIADAVGRASARYVPSAFSIAVLLTLLTFVLALTWGGASVTQVVDGWGDGFWELLTFSMQMALVMFTGYLLALTPVVQRVLRAVASLARSPRTAIALMALASMAMGYVNWGLSIVASAILVRYVVRQQPKVDYRLLVAAAYFGLGATWHAGFSASVPLLMATPKHFLVDRTGVIPINETLFSGFNLVLLAVVVVVLTTLAVLLHPPPERTVTVNPALLEGMSSFTPPARPAERTVATWFDHSRTLNLLVGLTGLAWLVPTLWGDGWRQLNINTVNFTFLMVAILLHRSPAAVLKATDEAATVLGGIVLQFPLYAGIYGVFKFTGLTEKVGEAFVSMSTPGTFPAIVYWYSGVVNYFVPSGGSKWAIEATYLLDAAARLGVDPKKVILAYAWGDMSTNMLQPFWALPLLAVAKLEFKEVLGFLVLVVAVYVPLVSLAFLFFL